MLRPPPSYGRAIWRVMPCAHGCDARIAELEGRIAELEGDVRREREDKERALAACQFVQDRLDFVEPMYFAVRRDNESLWAANTDARARMRGVEAGQAEVEERDLYRGAAADVQVLREKLAAEKDARINAENHCRMLINRLNIDPRTSKVVYRKGASTPPSARKREAGAPAGGVHAAGGAGGQADADAAGGPAAGAPCRASRAAGRAARGTAAPTSRQGRCTTTCREMTMERWPCGSAGAARATGCLSTTRGAPSWT